MKLAIAFLTVIASLLFATNALAADEENYDRNSPQARYLAEIAELFRKDGKLMAHVIIDTSDSEVTDKSRANTAANYVLGELMRIQPPPEAESAHRDLMTVFNMAGQKDASQIHINPALVFMGVPPEQLVMVQTDQAFTNFRRAVQGMLKAQSLPKTLDPWYTAKFEDNGIPNMADSSAQYGLTRQLRVQEGAPALAGFWTAVGAKRK